MRRGLSNFLSWFLELQSGWRSTWSKCIWGWSAVWAKFNDPFLASAAHWWSIPPLNCIQPHHSTHEGYQSTFDDEEEGLLVKWVFSYSSTSNCSVVKLSGHFRDLLSIIHMALIGLPWENGRRMVVLDLKKQLNFSMCREKGGWITTNGNIFTIVL